MLEVVASVMWYSRAPSLGRVTTVFVFRVHVDHEPMNLGDDDGNLMDVVRGHTGQLQKSAGKSFQLCQVP